MNNKTILHLKSREKIRLKSLSNLNTCLDFNDYMKNQSIFGDDYLYYSSYEFFNHLDNKKITSFYVPEWLIYFMIDKTISNWLSNKENSLKNIRILDPFCVSGFFTHILIEYLFVNFKFLYPTINEAKLLKKIIEEHIFSWDIRSEAVELCQNRIKNIFDVEAINVKEKNIFLENQTFDIIIGVPPVGDLLSNEFKEFINSSESNITLDFMNYSKKIIHTNGEICFLVSHDISYLPNYGDFRKNIYLDKSLYSITDIEVIFKNINYEALIINLNKKENLFIQSDSFKDFNYKAIISYQLFYNKFFNYKLNLYWDNYYQSLQDSFPQYPLSTTIPNSKILNNDSIEAMFIQYFKADNSFMVEKYNYYFKRYIFNNSKKLSLNNYFLKQVPLLKTE